MLEVCADLNAFVPGRPIDDDGAAFLRYENGVVGTLTASQVAVGEENNIRIRIYGDKGGLEWQQQEPNTLYAKWSNKPTEVIRMGNNGFIGDMAKMNTRTPGGIRKVSSSFCQYLQELCSYCHEYQERRKAM